MDKDEFLKTLGQLFDTDCNYGIAQMFGAPTTNRTFTESERTIFLTHLYEFFVHHSTKPDFMRLTYALITTQGMFQNNQDRAAHILSLL